MYHYAGNNPVKYTDPDGKIVNLVIGATIGLVTSTATEVGARMMQGQSFTDAICNTFDDTTSLAIILTSTAIGAVTSGVSGIAVNAVTKSVSTAATLGAKTGAQAIAEITVKTTVINSVSGAIDAGAKDIAIRAIKGEKQSFLGTTKAMGEGALSAAVFSGVTESIIAAGTNTTSEIENVLTGTIKELSINQPNWAGSVGNIGENVIPTGIDLGKESYNVYKKIKGE